MDGVGSFYLLDFIVYLLIGIILFSFIALLKKINEKLKSYYLKMVCDFFDEKGQFVWAFCIITFIGGYVDTIFGVWLFVCGCVYLVCEVNQRIDIDIGRKTSKSDYSIIFVVAFIGMFFIGLAF